MKKLIPIIFLFGGCVALYRPLLANDLSKQYEIVRFNQARYKVSFGDGAADGWIGDEWAITNLTSEPFTLFVARPQGGRVLRLRREGSMVFGANPKWTATILDKETGRESALTILDRVDRTARLGTNEYFVVDINIVNREVLLKDIRTGALITLHGIATNRTENVEQAESTVPSEAAQSASSDAR